MRIRCIGLCEALWAVSSSAMCCPLSLFKAWQRWRGDPSSTRNSSPGSPLPPCPGEPFLSPHSGGGEFPSFLEPFLCLGPVSEPGGFPPRPGRKACHPKESNMPLGHVQHPKCSPLTSDLGLYRFVVVFLFFFNAYLFLRERDCEQGRGRKRGRQRIQSRLCTDSREPDLGLEPTTCEIMT